MEGIKKKKIESGRKRSGSVTESFLNCGKCPFWEGWIWRGIQREEKCQDILPFFSINVNDTVLSHTGPSSGLMPSVAGIWLLTALTWKSLSQNHLRPEKAASSRAACIQWLVDFIWGGGSQITADSDCSHEIRRLLLLGRKPMTNLESALKSRHHFTDKGLSSQSYDFSSSHVGMWELDP